MMWRTNHFQNILTSSAASGVTIKLSKTVVTFVTRFWTAAWKNNTENKKPWTNIPYIKLVHVHTVECKWHNCNHDYAFTYLIVLFTVWQRLDKTKTKLVRTCTLVLLYTLCIFCEWFVTLYTQTSAIIKWKYLFTL